MIKKILDVYTDFCGDKILYKNQTFPTRFCFTFYGDKILYKIFPRFSDGRKCALLAKSSPKISKKRLSRNI